MPVFCSLLPEARVLRVMTGSRRLGALSSQMIMSLRGVILSNENVTEGQSFCQMIMSLSSVVLLGCRYDGRCVCVLLADLGTGQGQEAIQ